jgi:HEAT repeat protein
VGLVRRDTQPHPAEARPQTPAREVLEQQLTGPDPEGRRAAARELDGCAAAVPALLERLGVEPERIVWDAILTTLVGHDTPAVAAGLAAHLASEDAGLRSAVADALALMPESVPTLMPGLLADPDPDIRIMTAMVLANLQHAEAEAWLITMIRDDPHANVVTAAIDALLPSARAEHATLLREAMQRLPGDPFLRFVVESVLARLVGTTT